MKTLLALLAIVGYLNLVMAVLQLQNVDLATVQTTNPEHMILITSGLPYLSAGDVNNDGMPDIIIGSAFTPGPSGTGYGCAYIIFGQAGGLHSDVDPDAWDSSLGIQIYGVPLAEGNFLGSAVGPAGDFNNDGVDDVFVSAPMGNGVVYVIFGHNGLNSDINLSTLTPIVGIKIFGDPAYGTFGYSGNKVGDVNGDNIDDLAIRAQDVSSVSTVFVVFGKSAPASNVDLSSPISGKAIRITSAVPGVNFGNVIKSGDFNGDGINDIITSASSSPGGITAAGSTYLIFGQNGLNININADSLGSHGVMINGNTPNLGSGFTLSTGDLNGDGNSDAIIGAPSGGSSSIGFVYVIFGKATGWSDMSLGTLTGSDGITIIGADAYGGAGSALEVADYNQDGITDLILSAPGASPSSRSYAGIIYVILGKTSGFSDIFLSSFDSTLGVTIIGPHASSQAGTLISKVGDLDGDGLDDLLVQLYEGVTLFCTASAQLYVPPPTPPPDSSSGGSNSEDSNYGDIIQRVVSFEVTAGTIIGFTTSGLQMSQSGVMAVITGVLLAKQLQFIRYIDVNYAPRLMLTFQKQPYNLVTVNFGPLFPESLEDDAFKSPAPARFARYINGLLVINFWRGLTTLGILLIVLCTALVLSKIPIKNEILKLVSDKFQSFILLNYMFSFILSNTDNIILFSIVEYKSLNLDGGLAITSFIISILCLLTLLGILAFIPYHLYRLKKTKYQSKEDKMKAHDVTKVLFEEVKDKYFIQELFLFVICSRVVLHNIVIGALETPILQASLLIVLNVLMVAYILTLLPHRQMISNVEVVGYEIMIFIANVTCLCIATRDPADQPNAEMAGDVILVANIIVLAFSMGINGVKVLLKVLPIIKEKLVTKKKKPERAQSTEQTPLALLTPTEGESPSHLKSPKHVEMEGDSLLAVANEDVESNKIETRTSNPIRILDTLGKVKTESNRELLQLESVVEFVG